MKKYAILIALAAMLCGTEAGAIPSISYKTFNDEVSNGSLDNLPVTNVFQTFASPPPLLPDPLVDRVVIEISVPNGELGTSVYIDNIRVTADLGGASPQTIGFDGSVFVPNSQVLEVPVTGTVFDTFKIEGLGFPWTLGSSIFVTPNSANLAQLVITLPERYTRQDFLNGDITEAQIGTKKLVDSGAKFSFHSADLRISNGACDININGCGGGNGSVPEPASLLLLGAGLAGIGIWRRKAAR